ncbi:MAG: tRNA lysidine(34) synthetase TilS [Planctomycetota bacterium]|jgi:tRNA(Ile)-lysidine synthase
MKLLPQLLQTVARCLARHEVQAAEAPLLAAVSGGLDSSTLALVLAALREAGRLSGPGGRSKVVLAHVDHGVFPGSEDGTRAVARQAQLLGHGFVSRRLSGLPAQRLSEEALRDARYRALAAMARECGARMILTAHHADDNLETILFRMLRGTGPRGLSGIPEGRWLENDLWVVRPFLHTRRHTLHRAFEHAQTERTRQALPALPTVEDPTNKDLGYARNHLRQQLIPQLRAAMGVKLDASLFALARSARAAADVLAVQAGRLLREHARFMTPWRCELLVDQASGADRPFLEEALLLAHQRLHQDGRMPPWTWVQRVMHLLHQPDGRRVSGPKTVLAERIRGGLLLLDEGRAGAPPRKDLMLLPAAGAADVRFGDTEWRILGARHEEPPLQPSPTAAGRQRALLDPRCTRWPWRLRARRPGDRFQPLGQAHDVELRRFLQGRHVPRFDRDRLPLLVDADDQVLWVPGVEISAAAQVRLDTGECVELQLRTA